MREGGERWKGEKYEEPSAKEFDAYSYKSRTIFPISLSLPLRVVSAWVHRQCLLFRLIHLLNYAQKQTKYKNSDGSGGGDDDDIIVHKENARITIQPTLHIGIENSTARHKKNYSKVHSEMHTQNTQTANANRNTIRIDFKPCQ